MRNCLSLRDNRRESPTPLLRPRTREALTELDYILEDQVAALADATDDDKADAATWAA